MNIFNGFPAATLLLALLAPILASCTVVVEEPLPEENSGPRYCSREYEPVCARRNGERRTFANACRAETSGYRIIRYGECRREQEPEPEPRPRPRPRPQPEPDQISCTADYRPVCAVRNQDVRTFPNACEAGVASYRVVGQGPC